MFFCIFSISIFVIKILLYSSSVLNPNFNNSFKYSFSYSFNFKLLCCNCFNFSSCKVLLFTSSFFSKFIKLVIYSLNLSYSNFDISKLLFNMLLYSFNRLCSISIIFSLFALNSSFSLFLVLSNSNLLSFSLLTSCINIFISELIFIHSSCFFNLLFCLISKLSFNFSNSSLLSTLLLFFAIFGCIILPHTGHGLSFSNLSAIIPTCSLKNSDSFSKYSIFIVLYSFSNCSYSFK